MFIPRTLYSVKFQTHCHNFMLMQLINNNNNNTNVLQDKTYKPKCWFFSVYLMWWK